MKKATARSSGNGIWCDGNITVYFFEDQVGLDHTSFIDGYIGKTHVMIEDIAEFLEGKAIKISA